MQTVSTSLSSSLTNYTQTVLPYVVAEWGSSRTLSNLISASSSDIYTTKTKSMKPVLYWKLYDTSGSSTILDSSGADIVGTPSGIAGWRQTGHIAENDAKSMQFTSAAGSEVVCSNSILDFTDGFIVEAWLNFKSASLPFSASESAILAKASGDSAGNRKYGIYLDTVSGETFLSAKVYVGSTEYKLTSSTPITNTNTYYVALILTKSALNNKSTFYFIVNEEICGPTTFSGNLNSTTGNFAVGRNGGSTVKKNPTLMYVSNVAIYSVNSTQLFSPKFAITRYLSGINIGTYGSSDFFSSSEACNGKNENSFLWSILDAKDQNNRTITANGKYYLGEQSAENKMMEYGWSSRQLSDSGGAFAKPESLVMEFDNAPVNAIDIHCPVDYGAIYKYDVEYKNAVGKWTVLAANQIMPKEGGKKRHSFSSLAYIGGVAVKVYSTNNPFDVARINEISPIFEEEISQDVIDFSISTTRENYDSSVPIGVMSSGSLNINFDNTDQSYSKRNNITEKAGLVGVDAKIETYLRYVVDQSTTGAYGSGKYGDGQFGNNSSEILYGYEDIKQGEFFVDTASTDSDGMRVAVSARDKAKFLQENNIKNGIIYKDITAPRAIANLARYGGVENSKIKYQKTYKDLIVEKNPLSYWRMGESIQTNLAIDFGNGEYGGIEIGNVHYDDNFPYKANVPSSVLTYSPGFDTTGSNELTLEFWINYSQPLSEIISSIVCSNHRIDISNINGYIQVGITNGQFTTYLSKTFSDSLNRFKIDDGKWHHVCVRIGVYSKDKVVADVLIDGYPVSTQTSKAISASLSLDIQNWYFHNQDNSMGPKMADIRIFSTRRTDIQIQDDMAKQLYGHESDLFAYWRINNSTLATKVVNTTSNMRDPNFIRGNVDADAFKKYNNSDVKVEYIQNMTNGSHWLANTVQSTSAQFVAPYPGVGKWRGLKTPGDIDLLKLTPVTTNDGRKVTLNPVVYDLTGNSSFKSYVIIPTLIGSTQNSEAQAQFIFLTNYAAHSPSHLGMFDTLANANTYLSALLKQQYEFYNQTATSLVKNPICLEYTDLFKYEDTSKVGNLHSYAGLELMAKSGPLSNDKNSYSVQVGKNGVFSDFLYTNPNSVYRGLNELSFFGFINLDVINGKASIVSANDEENIDSRGGSTNGSFYFYVALDGSLNLEIKNKGTVSSAAGSVQPGSWYHVGFTIKKNVTNNLDVALYIDGEKIVEQLASTALFDVNDWIPGSLKFGQRIIGQNQLYGKISEFSLFNYALSSQDVVDMYVAAKAHKQIVYPYLWGYDTNIWDAMLNIATPDVGAFYFDKSGNFIYESKSAIYDDIYDSHHNSQLTLNDSDFIISGSETIDLMTNSVTCKVYSIASGGVNEQLWSAQDNESLAVTTLTNDITQDSSDISFEIISMDDGAGGVYPTFGTSGYIKIEDEIIKFNSSSRNTLSGCERGVLGTTASAHSALITNSSGESRKNPLFEVRSYDITFSAKPLLYVKNPFITQQLYGKVKLELWQNDGFTAKLIVSAYDQDVEKPHSIKLQGTEAANGLGNDFEIFGIVFKNSSGSEKIETATAEIKDQIRRHKIKAIDIDNQFVTTKEIAQDLVNYFIDFFKNGASIISISTMGLPHLELGDKITIGKFDQFNIQENSDWWVIGNNITYDGSVRNDLILREVTS